MARSRDVPLSFEGSTVGPSRGMLPAACELRYEMIVPWLVAPLPNSGGHLHRGDLALA